MGKGRSLPEKAVPPTKGSPSHKKRFFIRGCFTVSSSITVVAFICVLFASSRAWKWSRSTAGLPWGPRPHPPFPRHLTARRRRMAQRGERETRRQNLQSSSTGILSWRQQPRRRRRSLFVWSCTTRTLTAQEQQQQKQPGESCVLIPPLLNPSSLIPPPPLFPPPPAPPPHRFGCVA